MITTRKQIDARGFYWFVLLLPSLNILFRLTSHSLQSVVVFASFSEYSSRPLTTVMLHHRQSHDVFNT